MQLYTVTTDPMLLEYALMASQSPLTVSPPQGDANFVTLTFIVSKPRKSANVEVSAINFTFPYGSAASDLTIDPIPETSASISTTGKETWQIRQGLAPGMFSATPPPGSGPVTISDQSLTITFARVQISPAVGTADVTIVELATIAGTVTPLKHTKEIPKFPGQFFVTGFSSTTPSVNHDEQATLVWQGSADAHYLMLWDVGHSENVDGKRLWLTHKLTNTTSFMLQVTAQSAGETVTFREVVTVTVLNPHLVATDLRIGDMTFAYAAPPNDGEFVLRNGDAAPGKNGGVTIGNRTNVITIGDTGTIKVASTTVGGGLVVAADNRVGIGTTDPPQAALQIADAAQDPDHGSVIIGPVGSSSGAGLRLGCQTTYSWVQGHGGQPLAINPIGNGVGIGTTTPKNALDVKGSLVVGSSLAGTQGAPENGLRVQGDVALDSEVLIKGRLTSTDPDGQGVQVKGNLHATGRLVSWNPIDVFFPEQTNKNGTKGAWYRVTYYGSGYACWDYLYPSDIGLKEEVRPIAGALAKVMRLQGALYRWNEQALDFLTRGAVDRVSAGPDATPEEHEALRRAERQRAVDKLSGDQLGLIAQQVEEVVPEAVSVNDEGHKCVRYPELVALLVEAIKEQAAQIEALTTRVNTPAGPAKLT